MSKVYKQLSDLGEIITGKTPSTANNDFWDGEIPFITPTDINGYDTFYQSKTERYVSILGASKQKKTILPPNSVCITCIGSTIGKPCVTKVESITNQQINSIVPNGENDYRYVYYLIRENLPYIQLIGGGSGSGTPIISKNKFAKFKFLIEDNLSVQRRIASILSAYDNLIENNNRRIRLLEQMAENLYKEWFVRFRFPDHEKAEFENGLPKNWEYKNLFEVADVSYGYAFKSDLFCNDESMNAVVRIRDIQDNHTDTFTSEACDDKYLIEENAILVGMDGLFHMCLWNGKKAYLNQRVVKINSKLDNLCNYFLFMTIRPQVKFWEQVIAGTTVAHLGDKHLRKMRVTIPDGKLLVKADGYFRKIMVEKNQLFKQNALLSRQRDLLLPRLMSGKLEVKV